MSETIQTTRPRPAGTLPPADNQLKRALDWYNRHLVSWTFFLLASAGVPALYFWDQVDINRISLMGEYLAFAIVAVSLDLLWGYGGMLCLCQAFFFCLGGYAMGMYLAHHGGPEGIIDVNGWKLPACLYVVYPYKVGEAPEHAMVPWFWKPFWTLPGTLILGLLIPGAVSALIGYSVFRSRVRGVFFAVLTQAVTLAAWLVFAMNEMKLGGTNGLTRFARIGGNEFKGGYDLSEPNVKLTLYVITVCALGATYALCSWLVRSRFGRVLIAIRDNESRLRFYGYEPYHFKVFIFAISAMFAGLGGMIYAPQMRIITPHNMQVSASILVVIWVAVGGRGTLSGAVLGALTVNLAYFYFTSQHELLWAVKALFEVAEHVLPSPIVRWCIEPIYHSTDWILHELGRPFGAQLTRDRVYHWFDWQAEYWQFALGGLFVAVVLFLPDGLLSLWHRWKRWIVVAAICILVVNVLPEGEFKKFLTALMYLAPVAAVVAWGRNSLRSRRAQKTQRSWSAEEKLPASQEQKSAKRPETDESLRTHLQRVALLQRDRTISIQQRSLLDSELVRVENVKVLFDGFKALDIDEFSIDYYELQVVIGPNGAGKTTLCDVISGKTRATSGKVFFAKQDITRMPDVDIARLGVGRKFQTPSIFDGLTVQESMELALPGRQSLMHNFRTKTASEDRDKIDGILKRVRLKTEADKLVKYLSHGQRQWLEISMLLLARPHLLLVDEPAAGLTDEETALTAELLLELQDEHSVLVIEHDMEFVRLLNAPVTVLNEGKVMARGSLEQVQADPKVVEAYLGRGGTRRTS